MTIEHNAEYHEVNESLHKLVINDEIIQKAHQYFREGKTECGSSPELP